MRSRIGFAVTYTISFFFFCPFVRRTLFAWYLVNPYLHLNKNEYNEYREGV